MRHLEDAIQRQEAVQRKRTFSWALFGILLPVSVLFWLEVVFALGHFSEVGALQLSAESVVALLSTLGAIQAFRTGLRYNRLLADPSRLLHDSADTE
jgi:hypothetical protein